MADMTTVVLQALIVFACQPIFLLGNISDHWRRQQHDFFPPPDYVPPPSSTAAPFAKPTTDAYDDDPIFDNSLVTNVTAQLGKIAHLPCKVLLLKKDNPVSWIRRRDWNILSAGEHVFTQDKRFQLHHSTETREWTLIIKYLQDTDEGTYVCQVSTKSGVKSHYFNLHVLVPTAFILGSEEYHTQAGNAISLVCIIENSLEPPQYVFWYHNDQLINYDRISRVSIKTDPGPKTHSRLIINDVIKDDSGNYTCSAPNTQPSTIDVFVSQGDKTLSLSDHSSADRHLPSMFVIVIVTAIVYLR